MQQRVAMFGVGVALLAVALFGASTPFTKLLGVIDPTRRLALVGWSNPLRWCDRADLSGVWPAPDASFIGGAAAQPRRSADGGVGLGNLP